MSRGLDLLMELDVDSRWIRTSKNEARVKTDYERVLEREVINKNNAITNRGLTIDSLTRQISFLKICCVSAVVIVFVLLITLGVK